MHPHVNNGVRGIIALACNYQEAYTVPGARMSIAGP